MNVSHIKSPFLPNTEIFIYNYITGLKRYNPIIISEYQQNKDLSINKNINFLGMLSHKDFVKQCYENHIFVAPSQKDNITGETEGGVPTVILEALATSMPVIGSNHADIPNMIIRIIDHKEL